MSVKINIRPETKAFFTKLLAALALTIQRLWGWVKTRIAAIKANRRAMWFVYYAARWLIVILILVVYTIGIYRVAFKKARAVYDGWMEEYKADQIAAAEEAARAAEEATRAAPVDPYEAQLDAEAELLAKVLYGVKDNDNDDLRTYCWCVFNRVDNVNFPSSLEDVIAQPNQWMRYDPTNPILESLFQLAREQLHEWHTNTHRPCSADYVFMNWSKNDICLRDVFSEGSGTHYWRWNQ